MEANASATTEEFEAKTKDFESVSHRVFQSAYAAGGDSGAGASMPEGGIPGMGAMPGGMGSMPGMGAMPDIGGMPGMEGMDMSKMKEFFDKLSPDQKEHIEKMTQAQMAQNKNQEADEID